MCVCEFLYENQSTIIKFGELLELGASPGVDLAIEQGSRDQCQYVKCINQVWLIAREVSQNLDPDLAG